MPGRDVSLFADVVSNRVEIVFGTKDLSEENIKKFTNESFVIEKFERTDGETVVIIVRFEDPDEGKKFVREVSSFARGGDGDSLIRGDEIVPHM